MEKQLNQKDIIKIEEKVRELVDEETYRQTLKLKNKVKKKRFDGMLEASALLYYVEIDRVFELLMGLNLPLSMVQRLCNTIHPDMMKQESEQTRVIREALVELRTIKDEDIHE